MKSFSQFYVLIFAIILSFSCSKEKRSDKAAEKMQDFVVRISNYAKSTKSNFIIIPQNGVELVFNNLDINDGFHPEYFSAIDGLGVEELFYNGSYLPDNERLSMLRKLAHQKKILVSEYVANATNISDAYSKNLQEGFICFVRNQTNYHYHSIPDTIVNENSNDVLRLSDAQNYLYLINTERYSNKQDFIQAIAATNYDLLIIDLFFGNEVLTANDINLLKHKANGAKRLVISYINIGAAETFRYYWKKNWKLHHPSWIKKKYSGYNDEYWVKFWHKDWQNIIYGNDQSYIKKIIDAGFDGAYLDNVEAYYFLYFDE